VALESPDPRPTFAQGPPFALDNRREGATVSPLVILSTDDFRNHGATETPPGPQPPSDPEPDSGNDGEGSRAPDA